MSLISMLCPRCLGDSFERDHAYKCRPPELDMTPTVPPSPAQGETAGVSEERLGELRQYVCTLWRQCRANPRPQVGEESMLEDLLTFIDGARQQLADSAHEVERLNAANAAMRGLLVEAEALLCDVRGGPVANELAVHIRAALAPTSHDPVRSAGETRPVPERGKCERCSNTGEIRVYRKAGDSKYRVLDCPDCVAATECKTCGDTREVHGNNAFDGGDAEPMDCPDCAQGGSPADPERQGAYDIVAGLREILAGKNVAIDPSIINHAIAALGEKGALQGKLKEFGRHPDQCARWVHGPRGSVLGDRECTCGLDAAIGGKP